MSFFVTWFITTLATMAAIYIVPGIVAVGGSYMGPIMCSLALALVNALIRPIIEFLSLPVNILTLGLFGLIINAFMLQLAGSISRSVFGAGIEISSFGSAFVGALIISIASAILGVVIGA